MKSFAAYSEALYFEQKFDNPTYWKFLNSVKSNIQNLKPIVGPPDSNTDQLDVGDIYYKGANILAIFRELVGKDIFLDILRNFAMTPSGSSGKLVTTDDFYRLIEEKTGQSYRWFFEPYLKKAELPLLKSRQRGDLLTLTWAMAEPFPLPMTVEYNNNGRRFRKNVQMVNNTGTVNIGTGEGLQIGRPFSRMFRLERVAP